MAPERTAQARYDCDYLVVGAGAAGCVVAARLSEDPKVRVILLEAGPEKNGLVNRVPALAFLASIDARTNWNFTTEPIPGLNHRRQQWSQGRMLGGSSGINGMLWMRGCRADYELWAQTGCPGWGWDDVLPVYRGIEASDRGAGPFHGDRGPLPIRRSRLDLGVSDLFLQAMEGAGLPLVDDVNADVAEGFGRFDVNVGNGERQGAARVWLAPARGRPNLTVLGETTATRLLTENGRVRGAEARRGEQALTIHAARETVLCCGAIRTPHLLHLSGIGPAERLSAMGIAPVLDRPAVGENLHNHPSMALRFALRQPISAWGLVSPLRAPAIGLDWLLRRRGALGESYVALGGVMRSDPMRQAPDVMVVVMPGLVKRAEVGAKLSQVIERRHGFAVMVSLARPESRGRVGLHAADPAAPPRIEPGYFSDPADMRAMVRALTRLRGALHAPELADRIGAELPPTAGAGTEAELAAAVRGAGATFYHPGGTCRMGSDPGAVTDPRLRLRGLTGLRIADASVVPAPISASMHAPCLLIGERAARFIRDDHAAA